METLPEGLLVRGAAELSVSLGEEDVKLYLKYLDSLLEWNQKINLTAIKDPEEIIIKHFLDSISVLPYITHNTEIKLLDVGTGAGFPGVPVKISSSGINVVLLDSLNKRITFLNNLIGELNLSGITTVHGRAEDFAHKEDFRECFDVVVSRAVSKLSVLAELCLPFVKIGGKFIAYKGPKVSEELAEAEIAIKTLGGGQARVIDITLPDIEDKRNLVIIDKDKPTPPKYPRKAGTPEKKPL